MANGVFNIAKGRVNQLHRDVNANDPANSALVVVLLRTAVADATLEDFDTLSALIADAGVDEATFTNYARKIVTDADISDPTVDDTNSRQDADLPDQTYTSAGGATNNTLVKLLICFDNDTTSGDDTNIIPLTHHDFAITTDGSDVVAQFNAAGYFRAA
jgi:hypothetical protein